MIARAPRATTCRATAKPMPDDPPSTTIRLSESSRVILSLLLLCHRALLFCGLFCGLQPFATPQ
jgi:hypothetical protein